MGAKEQGNKNGSMENGGKAVRVELLAGKRQPRESHIAVQACNDFLRLGPGRSLPDLLARYTANDQESPPTASMGTLKQWSARFDWQARAALYDAGIERETNQVVERRRRAVMEEGLGLNEERVKSLKSLAALLNDYLDEEERIWLPDVKQIGSGPSAERVDIVRFNAALIEQYRGVLGDLAAETGGRRQQHDHLLKYVDFSRLTPEQLDRIAAGEDPFRVLVGQ